ncbi:pyruvate dehydrogenase (acetyl-transferring) E1 component subunit alpha [Arthrobacter sp. CAU 1506]|uniref:pyruvate dehydrogenase (acetyl-transferring) E1 component subunit alpha n=1 Tax=Arthrobacter sp. CAU 1506 TaxID=2560052 RepID=UPI0010AD22AD|nr:pyruvate dehydrogenase (acetyl-transferring) E1 component subunit alpha [Arthrobacter sp. CAU 1506]TJY68996.1 pyruvate dehydrogenase (acetyl-transferring) E1 component subunit alpha [Arthrobacter sp. CAU 1506]
MGAEHLPASEFDIEELEQSLVTSDPADAPPLVQLMAPDGSLREDTKYGHYAAHLDGEALRAMYRDMALVRRFDQEATALQRQGQLLLWPPLLGQEAAQIGSGTALQAQDYVFPTYREHGVALTRGLELSKVLRLFRGVSNGGWDPRESNFHLYTLVLAAQSLHAVGYAMGVQRDGDDAVTVAYFGDGASSEGDVHESMVFAASNQSPVVFFCQNNHWAISVPTEVQSRIPLSNRASGYGFPGVRVDGNDVVAVHAVTRWALERARSGKGPVLIEAFTYRMSAHTTADDPTKYRELAEEEKWRERDPLLRLERYLRSTNTAGQDFFDQIAAEADKLAASTRADVLAMEAPDFEDHFANVYAEPHPLIREELEWHRQYQAGFAEETAGQAEGEAR